MAVQEQISIRGSGLTYPTTKPIASKSHMEVQVHDPSLVSPNDWIIVNVLHYDLISNACVFIKGLDLSPYDFVNVRVADTPNELLMTPDNISIIVSIADEIVIVAGIADEVVTVANIDQEVVTVAALESRIIDITSNPLRQAILDAEGNADDAQTSADNAEASYQATLLVEAEVIAQGDIQEARIIAEGDDQVARVIVYADETEDSSGEALAEAQNADQWANAPIDTDVIKYTWNPVTDLIESAPMPNSRSAFHWQEIAKTTSAGLTFQDTWDSVDCSLPPIPVPPIGELANGYFYILGSVTGDTTGCSEMSEGDWLVWSGDQTGDSVVEGAWQLVNWSFSWNAILNVTVDGLANANGDDLASVGKVDTADLLRVLKTGDTMTGQLKLIAPVDDVDATNKVYVDDLNDAQQIQIDENTALISVFSGVLVGSMYEFASDKVPNGSLLCDGSYVDKIFYASLYTAIGDIWNNAGGAPTPPDGFFRVPISQDLKLFNIDEYEGSGDLEMGTYQHNTLLDVIAPVSCIIAGAPMSNSVYVNDDLIGNASYMYGFNQTITYSDNDFVINVVYNNGFGDEVQYVNNDLEANVSYNNGFSNPAVYGNIDFVGNAYYMNGFGTLHFISNDDLLGNAVYLDGFGTHESISNTNFQVNSYYMDGFGVPNVYNNNDFVANSFYTDGFGALVSFNNIDFVGSQSHNSGFIH